MKQLIILTILFVTAICHSLDYLAADQTVARYRTGEIDTKIAQIPDRINQGVFTNPQVYLPQLVDFLVNDTNDPFLKVKRIYDWITDNIAYDSDLFLGYSQDGTREPYELLRIKRTTCGGFAKLFKLMADFAGIEAVYINGYSRSYYSISNNEQGNHAWNGVRINGKWYIVDSTNGNRRGYIHGVFSEKRNYKDTALFIRPDAYYLGNLPYNETYQFLDTPITYENFMSQLRLLYNFVAYNIEFVTDMRTLIKEGRTLRDNNTQYELYDLCELNGGQVGTISLKAPNDTVIRMNITDGNDTKYPFNSYTEYSNGIFTCYFTVPDHGDYNVVIQASKKNERSYKQIYKFTLRGNSRGQTLPIQTDHFYDAGYFTVNNLHLNNSIFDRVNNIYMLDISYNDQTSIHSALYDQFDTVVPNSTTISYHNNRKRFFYKIPAEGTYYIKVFSKNASDEGSHMFSGIVKLQGVSPNTGRELPVRNILYTNRFFDDRFELVNENVSQGPSNGVYRIVMHSTANFELGCTLKDDTNTSFDGHAEYTKEGGTYTLFFSAPDNKRYTARISSVNSEGMHNTIAYFVIEGEQRNPRLPLPDILHKTRSYYSHGYANIFADINENNSNRYYTVKINAVEGYRLSCTLKDSNNNTVNSHFETVVRGNDYTFYFSAPDNNRYHAKIFSIDGNDRYSTIAHFVIESQQKNAAFPVSGILFTNRRFNQKQLDLIDENVTTGGRQGIYSVTIRSNDASTPLECRLMDESNRSLLFYSSSTRNNNEYKFYFSVPDNRRYTAKIYDRNEEGRLNTVAYFTIENQNIFRTVPPEGVIHYSNDYFIYPFEIRSVDINKENRTASIIINNNNNLNIRILSRDKNNANIGRVRQSNMPNGDRRFDIDNLVNGEPAFIRFYNVVDDKWIFLAIFSIE